MEGGRKTAAGMAARYGGDIQALQQFVKQSPWELNKIINNLKMNWVWIILQDDPGMAGIGMLP